MTLTTEARSHREEEMLKKPWLNADVVYLRAEIVV